MTKSLPAKIALVILVLVVLSCSVMASTFAKYVIVANGTDVARVASWSVLAGPDGGAQLHGEDTIQFNLFDTLYDTQLEDGQTEPSLETDVANPDGKNLIAPGTQGKFALDLYNKSEVAAEFTVSFSLQNPDNVPIQFSLDGIRWYDTVEQLNEAELIAGEKALKKIPLALPTGDTPTQHTIIVSWKWDFETGNDANDTSAGINAKNVVMTAYVLADQVD